MSLALVNLAHKFKRYDNELFHVKYPQLIHEFVTQLNQAEYSRLIRIKVFVNDMIHHNAAILQLYGSDLNKSFDILDYLHAQCHAYCRVVRQIQRWWRWHHYRPGGRAYKQAMTRFEHLESSLTR